MRHSRSTFALGLFLLTASLSFSALAQECASAPNPIYDAAIKHNTTLPNFITELVDHLPASACVPSPETYFGHIIGAPGLLDHTDKLNGYLRLLESKSKRIKVFSLGQSEEGREMLVAAIADEATIAQLDHYKDITRRLADPRGLTPAAAAALVNQGKPMYWATGSIHSSETGSPEMLMELAYRLIVEDSPFIQTIRDHEITLITPLVETDGHDREVDLFTHRHTHPDQPTPSLLFWGHYVAHDNNRDGMTLALALSRNMMNGLLDWHPTVFHDLHESEPFLYISTGSGPYNPWLDPMQIDEWHAMAYHEIDEMTKRGVIGVWTHTYYDGWAPNYLFYFANTHNAIGRFYETQSAPGGGDTGPVQVGAAAAAREWYRPNPPLQSVIWSLRDNINMQESALLFGMNNVASNARQFLDDFYIKSVRAVAKGRTEGPAAWVFPASDARTYQQARILDQFQAQGVEVHRLNDAFRAGGATLPAGSYVLRMDQPYSRLIDMMLDKQYYSPDDPRPYDDTGWTQGALANIATVRVADTAILDAPMTKVSGDVAPPSGLVGPGASASATFIVNNNGDANLASFRFALASFPMQAAELAFDGAGRHFNAGSFLIESSDAAAIANAAKIAGVEVVAAPLPQVATHELAAPRIALMHNWQSTQNDGWFRVSLDQLKVPYTYIADNKIKMTANLRQQFDAIIVPPSIGGDLPAIIRGLPMPMEGGGQPIAWQNTPDMPDLVRPGMDSTADMRGGLGLSGIANLEQFVRQGGLLVTIGANAVIPIESDMAAGVTQSPAPATLIAGGGVVRAKVVDLTNPIAYGYDPDVALYYAASPILSAGGGAGGRGGRGGGRGGPGAQPRSPRTSGTGVVNDPDVIQARPIEMQQQATARGGVPPGGLDEGAQPWPASQSPAAGRGRGGAAAGGAAPRVIVRFADAKDLPLSGLLQGGEAIANQPAIVETTYGQGHVVMFAANPMWRNETSGAFAFLFNALLNYKSLDR